MELPKGYEAHIVPRSSTFKNFGIIQTNHMGIIDASYCAGIIFRYPGNGCGKAVPAQLIKMIFHMSNGPVGCRFHRCAELYPG